MLATTGTMQTTYSRNSQNKRSNISAGSKPHNHDRLMQLESSITPKKSGWQIEVHTNQTYDTWLTTTFPLTHIMTSAEVVEMAVTRQQPFSGLPASPGRSDYPSKSINNCSSEVFKILSNLFKPNLKRLLTSAAVLQPRKNCALKSQWTSELLLSA